MIGRKIRKPGFTPEVCQVANHKPERPTNEQPMADGYTAVTDLKASGYLVCNYFTILGYADDAALLNSKSKQ